jgi:hypothetical protein
MAAAVGTDGFGFATLAPLLGLASVLAFRERGTDLEVEGPAAPCWRWGGRAGELSREDCGELAVDGELDTLSAREPPRTCRIELEAGVPLFAGGAGASVKAIWAVYVVPPAAGSVSGPARTASSWLDVMTEGYKARRSGACCVGGSAVAVAVAVPLAVVVRTPGAL